MTSSPSSAGVLRWHHARLADLPALELARIYRARQRVFVVEQTCIYLDADALDETSWHLAAWASGQAEPVAYARVVDPGGHYDEPSIGRVFTSETARGTGLGRELVARALALCDAQHGGAAVRISAQIRLQRFYGEFGFEAQGEPYLEDDMPHIGMWRAPRQAAR